MGIRMKTLLGVMLLGLTATAAVVETTVDQTSAGDWEVTVDAGSSNVVSVVQSGAGRIVKKGAGTLVLKTDNTFTGGVELQAGFLRVEHDHALGSGTLTILGQRSDYTGSCELQIMGAGPGDASVLTIPNDIHVTGNTTGQYPALMAFGQNSVLTGTITADQDFYFFDDFLSVTAIYSKHFDRWKNILSLTFGPMNVAGTLGNAGMTRWIFNGKVTTPVFDLTVSRPMRPGDPQAWDSNGNSHSAFQFNVPSDIGRIVSGRHPIFCNVANALPNTVFHAALRLGWTVNDFYFNGYEKTTRYDQRMAGLSSDPIADGDVHGTTYTSWVMNAASARTPILTLTGVAPEPGETTKELVTGMSLNNGLSIVIDADPGFTQTVSNRTHTMSGSITVKSGGFRIAGTATFSNLTAVVVQKDGRFVVDSFSTTGLARKLKRIELADGGSFSVGEPCTIYVDTFTYNGVRMGGTFTAANCPVLGVGVTIHALPAMTSSATWIGAGAEGNMTTRANWQDAPEALDLRNGTMGVTLAAAGEHQEMVFQDGDFLYSITNQIPFLNESKTVSTPLVIKPAMPNDTLTLYRGIYSHEADQLVLSGHITYPVGVTPGRASSDNSYAIRYWAQMFSGAAPEGVIEGERSSANNGTAPLVLRNAVVDQPILLSMQSTQGVTLLADEGTTNRVNGDIYAIGYQGCVSAKKDAVLELRGGLRSQQTYRYVGPGEIRIVDTPVQGLGTYLEKNVHLVLDAEGCSLTGNTAREGLGVSSGLLEFRRSGCFNSGDLQLYFGTGKTASSASSAIEFNQTTQRVGVAHLNNIAVAAYLHGDYPAMLEVTGRIREGATDSLVLANTNITWVTGGLGFHVCGDTTFPIGRCDYTSCGDLEASAGTLELLADASWRCGTNFTARGTGTLKFHNARQIDRSFAQFHFADDGAVSIPSGVTLSVAAADVAGEPVPMGIYASGLTTGALANRVTGGGVLQVGRCGTLIIFK